jgi:hypothetical protein
MSVATSLAHLVRGIRLLMYWPVVYLIVAAIWRFRSRPLAAV